LQLKVPVADCVDEWICFYLPLIHEIRSKLVMSLIHVVFLPFPSYVATADRLWTKPSESKGQTDHALGRQAVLGF
jgi:hypothetical protein